MVPPGRRRGSPLLLLTGLFFIFLSTASAASAILGIDLGTEYIKAALVKPGIPLEIVLTKDSRRKEAATVAFKPGGKAEPFPERAYGSDAIALAARFPDNVFPNLKPLLGAVEGDARIADYRSRRPMLDLGSEKTRKTVTFTSSAFPEKPESFLVEELLAMELQNIRANAEAMAGRGSPVRDAIITIPSFYTVDEKRAVDLAAELAGLRVLALVSDGLAVGINYATSRTFPSITEGGKPEHHLVFDMGAGSTTATLVRFQGRTVKDVGRLNKTVQEVAVLGTVWDKEMGGDALNGVIADDIVKELTSSPHADKIATDSVKAHARASARIIKEAERVRQVLSANSETVAGFDELYEDVDFRYKITRTKFEEMTSPFADRIADLISKALVTANLTMSELDSVILHGGAIRTPFVQKQLEKVVGDAGKLRSNVNSDEAAVFGAAFKGASMSASFRVKEIRTSDCAGYKVGMQWKADGKDRSQQLFLPTSKTGVRKQVPLKNQQDFSFDLYQDIPVTEGFPDTRRAIIFTVQTRNLTASIAQLTDEFGCAATEIDTQFSIRLNPESGAPEVTRGAVSCEVEDSDKKEGVVDGVKNLFGFGSKKGDQEPLQDGEGSSSASSSSSDKAESSSSKKGSESKSAAAADKTAEPQKPTRKIQRVFLSFEVTSQGLPHVSAAEMKRMKTRLADFDASDKKRRLREEAVNVLEAFTYRSRDLLSDDAFIKASMEAERTMLDAKLQDASEWLYGDGAGAERDVLKARLKELKDLVDPIEKRKEEAVKRPVEVKLLQEALNQTKQMIGVIQDSVDKAAKAAKASASTTTIETTETPTPSPSGDDDFADLDDEDATTSSTTTTSSKKPVNTPAAPSYTPEDVDSISTTFESVNEWLTTKLAQQKKLAAHEDPVLVSSDIVAKSKELKLAVMQMLQKKVAQTPLKPKTSSVKPKSKSKKTKSSKTTSKSGTSTSTGKKEQVTVEMPDVVTPPSEEEMEAMIEQAKKKVAADQKVKKPKDKEAEGQHDPNEL